jgi:CHAD domain-containing protein
MAKAKEIPELDCAADALYGASKALLARFDEVLEFREAALDFSDIKGVHDMRVATRRVRSALRDFTPLLHKRVLKPLKKDLKQFADVLGAVRDLDVFIAALEELQFAAEDESIRQGIEKLIREQRALREVARLDLTESLERDKLVDLQKNFADAIDEAVRQKKSNRNLSFDEAGRDVIDDCLDNLLSLEACIYEPFNQNALHKFRLAAKRLRYAIQLFVVCLGDEISPFIKEIRQMQTILGTVHNCDVWIEILGERLRENKALDESDYQAATWLLSEFVSERTREYRSALNLWSEWKTNDFAERLRALI